MLAPYEERKQKAQKKQAEAELVKARAALEDIERQYAEAQEDANAAAAAHNAAGFAMAKERHARGIAFDARWQSEKTVAFEKAQEVLQEANVRASRLGKARANLRLLVKRLEEQVS